MGAINKGLSEIHFAIPPEILNIGFNDNSAANVLSVDEVILARIIRPRVLVDCNILGGIEIYIPISECKVLEYSDGYTIEHIIDVSKKLTGGKSIVTPLGIFSGASSDIQGSSGYNNTNPILNSLNNQMDYVGGNSPISTSRLELVGENKIVVNGSTVQFFTAFLKVVVENDNNLSNISPRSHLFFSDLCVLAVKAFIYNSMIVKLGQGYIYNGAELGIVNDIISGYESANEDYRLYLMEKWRSVAYHNDSTRLGNYVSGLI